MKNTGELFPSVQSSKDEDKDDTEDTDLLDEEYWNDWWEKWRKYNKFYLNAEQKRISHIIPNLL